MPRLVKQWYWGYIDSNIDPLESIPSPMLISGAYNPIFYSDTPLYNSAVFQNASNKKEYSGIWFFSSEPTLTKGGGYNGNTWSTSKWTDGTYWAVTFYVGNGDNSKVQEYTVPFYDTRQDFYNYVSTKLAPAYTFSPVQSITGNGKTYTLSQIASASINNGEPMNDVPATGNVDFTKQSKVNTLVENALSILPSVTKATVTYTMPLVSYSYVKLVYKEGDIPETVDDGTAMDISAEDNVAIVNGLEEDKAYYFVIFTSKTISEPYYFRTSISPYVFNELISVTKAGTDTISFTDDVSYTKVT